MAAVDGHLVPRQCLKQPIPEIREAGVVAERGYTTCSPI